MAAVAAVPVGDGVTINFLTEVMVSKDGVSLPVLLDSDIASAFGRGVGIGDFAGMFMNTVSIHSATMRTETFVSMLSHAESVPMPFEQNLNDSAQEHSVLQKHLCSEILRSTQTWQQQRLSRYSFLINVLKRLLQTRGTLSHVAMREPYEMILFLFLGCCVLAFPSSLCRWSQDPFFMEMNSS